MSHRYRPLPPRDVYMMRLARSTGLALGMLGLSLGIGMVGYRGFEGLSWLDSFLNASMILAGMGPANELHTSGGKVFAGCYAIFSGVVFLSAMGVVIAPVFHRFLHKFHLDDEN